MRKRNFSAFLVVVLLFGVSLAAICAAKPAKDNTAEMVDFLQRHAKWVTVGEAISSMKKEGYRLSSMDCGQPWEYTADLKGSFNVRVYSESLFGPKSKRLGIDVDRDSFHWENGRWTSGTGSSAHKQKTLDKILRNFTVGEVRIPLPKVAHNRQSYYAFGSKVVSAIEKKLGKAEHKDFSWDYPSGVTPDGMGGWGATWRIGKNDLMFCYADDADLRLCVIPR